MSQLDLAAEAEISQRHLSFVESGRAAPSREMVLHLAERLDIPLRQRNRLLLAAGFAPSFGERQLEHPSLRPAMDAIEQVLKGHEPNPALAVDRHWNLVRANGAIAPFMADIAEASLLAPLAYTEMIMATAAGWWFFGDFPDRWTFIGVGVLIACAIYISYRERKHGIRPQPEAPQP